MYKENNNITNIRLFFSLLTNCNNYNNIKNMLVHLILFSHSNPNLTYQILCFAELILYG